MKNQIKFKWNAGTGMVAGVVAGAVIAIAVSTLTGDQTIWQWAIPVGVAAGLAIGAGKQQEDKAA